MWWLIAMVNTARHRHTNETYLWACLWSRAREVKGGEGRERGQRTSQLERMEANTRISAGKTGGNSWKHDDALAGVREHKANAKGVLVWGGCLGDLLNSFMGQTRDWIAGRNSQVAKAENPQAASTAHKSAGAEKAEVTGWGGKDSRCGEQRSNGHRERIEHKNNRLYHGRQTTPIWIEQPQGWESARTSGLDIL